jgi:uncharacterized protein with ATP-grasp and redox domains
MRLTTDCMCCIIRNQEKRLKEIGVPEEKKAAYLKEVMKVIGQSEEECSAPMAVCRINQISEKYFGNQMDYGQVKHHFNQLVLEAEPAVRKAIRESRDPLASAIQYARAGNYIDFGALEKVEEEKLLLLLQEAMKDSLNAETYDFFREDLSHAKRLVYLTDNCGEIVLDRLLAEELLRQYPQLSITVIVRGMPVLNDATLEDAAEALFPPEIQVMGNGSGVAGTELQDISAEAGEAIRKADLLISKGQGNFETLHGCGLNLYYLFLCKCQLFVERFGMKQFAGVFVNEKKNLKIRK